MILEGVDLSCAVHQVSPFQSVRSCPIFLTFTLRLILNFVPRTSDLSNRRRRSVTEARALAQALT